MPSFDHPILAGVPDHLLDVLDQIEALTGIRPSIREIDDKLRAEAPEMARAPAIADVHPAEGAIAIWFDPSQVATHVVAHEIMHLRRNLVESVPKIWSRISSGLANTMESELEHLFIIPEEIRCFPEAEEWWATRFREAITATEDGLTLFMTYPLVSITLPNHPDLAEACLDRMDALGHGNAVAYTKDVAENIRKALPDKGRVIEVSLGSLPEYLREQFFVGRYDPNLRLVPIELAFA